MRDRSQAEGLSITGEHLKLSAVALTKYHGKKHKIDTEAALTTEHQGSCGEEGAGKSPLLWTSLAFKGKCEL